MWYKIKELYSKGLNKTQIGKHLGLDRSTVRRYLKMDEECLTAKLGHRKRYPRLLDKYEDYVRSALDKYHFLSASQIHDWMMERYPDFPDVSGKTVYNFVRYVRRKYNIEKGVFSGRIYEKQPETPYGQYAQVDFGESRVCTDNGAFIKVYFFAMVMSRSRYKFVYFSETPFDSALAVYAHELAFAYFGGKPHNIIYDQDKVLLVKENLGDLILTRKFRVFVNEQHFTPVFCRKADPESKGKIENVVKYVKGNFISGRTFHNMELLNAEAVRWLERTANGKVHGTTRLVPSEEFEKEREYLIPYTGEPARPEGVMKEYHVRKDNTIRYRSNYYSVPSGTYRNRNTVVWLQDDGDTIGIYAPDTGKLVCSHRKCTGIGLSVIDKDHHKKAGGNTGGIRDKILAYADGSPVFGVWLQNLEKDKPRYYKDNLKVLLNITKEYDVGTVTEALRVSVEKNIYNALVVRDIASLLNQGGGNSDTSIFPAAGLKNVEGDYDPAKTDINQYDKYFK